MQEQLQRRQQQEQQMRERRDELIKKREEETTRRTEHAAAVIARKVIQRIRVVQPENFDAIAAELETVMNEQLEKMGSLAEKIQQEAEKELLEAQQRLDQLSEKRAEEAKKKAEAEAAKQAQQEKADKMKQDATDAVTALEEKVSLASQASEALAETSKSGAHEDVLKAAQSAGELVEGAQASIAEAAQQLSVNWGEVDLPKAVVQGTKKEFHSLQARVMEAKKSLSQFSRIVKAATDKESRKAVVLKKEREERATFGKFDSKKKGMLNREDVRKFSKQMYTFDISNEQLDKVHVKLKGEAAGVPFEAFRRLRQMVAIERSCSRARARRAEEEKRKAELDAKKAEFKQLLAEADKTMDEGQAEVAKALAVAQLLLPKAAAKLSATELKAQAEKVDETVAPGAACLERARQCLDTVGAAVDTSDEKDDEVLKFQKQLLEEAKLRFKRIQAQLERCTASAKGARQRMLRKELSEKEALRFKTSKDIGDYMAVKELDFDKLFSAIAGGEDIAADKYVAFLRDEVFAHSGEKLDEEGEALYKALFQHVAGDAGTLSLDRLKETLLAEYRVAKAAMLSEGCGIDTKASKRLEEGEYLRGLECPRKDPKTGVLRVKCQGLDTGAEGWVSVTGNKGTAFLEPCSKYMICLKETVVTAELDVGSDTARKLAKDELLEVLQYPTKDPSCGVMRVKARTLGGDSAIGWVSVASSAGATFLEAC